jgi:hypothetical protein
MGRIGSTSISAPAGSVKRLKRRVTGGGVPPLFVFAMPRFHRFGDSRHSAEQSGFFKWFMLGPEAADQPAPHRFAAHYRPTGPAFHELAEFIVVDDADDQLQSLELRLAREFIDHSHNGLFARDVAKSLLRDAVDEPDATALGHLADEIGIPRQVSVPVITARKIEVDLPDEPSPGYQVFLGKRGRYEQRLGRDVLVLENYVRGSAPWLRMVLTAR